MFDGLTPDLAPRLVLAIGGVGVAFVILVLVLIFLKRRNSPLFIKGGKSREPRLMVLDAAAIDPKRRLVLIRRDDVEHLIMIGGPSDIVIETGIVDRAKPAMAPRTAPVMDEPAVSRSVSTAQVSERAVAPTNERRAEPTRVAAAIEAERPVAPVEVRAVQPPVQTTARATETPANVAARMAPASERVVERPVVERTPVERVAVERRPEDKNVSAAGAMLYGDDRESAPARPSPAKTSPQAQPTQSLPRPPVERAPVPATTTAEAVLDAARQRVMPNPQPAAAGMTTAVSESERALAARLESARTDMMRRVQSAQPTGQTTVQSAAEPVAQKPAVATETAKVRDAEPSDFEKLLEAELDANGVFGQAPQVRGESRVTQASPTDGAVPPVRVAPPITGATPDVSSEEEVARLLGEIAINRKS
jgi:hypothetical protein